MTAGRRAGHGRALKDLVDLSCPHWNALALPSFAVVTLIVDRHPRALTIGLELWTLVLLGALVDLVNRRSDEVEDAIDYPRRTAIYTRVGRRLVTRAVRCLVVAYLATAVTIVALGGVSPAASVLWIVGAGGPFLYSTGPRIKARSFASQLAVGAYPTYFFFFAAIQPGVLLDVERLIAPGLLLWLFGIALGGWKDLPNLAGDSEIGFRSVVLALRRDSGWARARAAASTLAPFAAAGALSLTSLPYCSRLWWTLLLLPIGVLYGMAVRRATSLSARAGVRELGNLYFLAFTDAVLLAVRPTVGTSVLCAASVVWWLVANRFLNCDLPGLTLEHVQAVAQLFADPSPGPDQVRWPFRERRPGPLAGIRVVELGTWVAVPGTGRLLADLGAEVVKVEHGPGDPLRNLAETGLAPIEGSDNPIFTMLNAGKHSVVCDLADPAQRRAFDQLLECADVFVTNLLPGRLERFSLAYGDLAARNPRLVYASLTGYGSSGPERDRPGFDYSALWGRSGMLHAMSPADAAPPSPRPGVGDNAAALAIASGVLAALFERSVTGKGRLVETSLLRVGLWLNSMDVELAHAAGHFTGAVSRHDTPNPLYSAYQCADGAWLQLVIGQADRAWPVLCRALDQPALLDDSRFATMGSRAEHCSPLVQVLDSVFKERTAAEWGAILDAHGIPWGRIATVAEVSGDPQVRLGGGFRRAITSAGRTIDVVAPPIDFARPGLVDRAPDLGEQTDWLMQDGPPAAR